MYVLADLEWVENKTKRISFTQIAMLRVDETWTTLSSIYRRVRPMDPSFHQWRHIAFTGGSIEDFLKAPDSIQAFNDITRWLQPSDEICWWSNESREWIQKLVPSITNKQIVLSELIENYLGSDGIGSPYHVGRHLFLQRPKAKHDSRNDVEMMRRVLEHVRFPQPIPEHIPKSILHHEMPSVLGMAYYAHIETNVIHKKGCTLIPTNGELKGYNELRKPVGKGYIPCDCVRTEFLAARRERNQAIIDRTEYSFVFSPSSTVFHKRDCRIALGAKSIMGTILYDSCAATGRHPCRVCNPKPEDETYMHVMSIQKSAPKKKPQADKTRSLSAEEQRAVKRHRQAQAERMAYKNSGALDQAGKDDLYTLTQPRFAFWAATGYNTFHLRHCKKMSGLTNLKGFSLHADAIAAGYRPCKCCKPTSKHDILLSLPIYSKKRYGDGVQVLIDACKLNAYEYSEDGKKFTLETPVGIWRINIGGAPYRVEHINTAMTPDNRTNFHHQPRIFHSLQDVFSYIKRHDDNIVMHAMSGSA